MPEQIFPGQLLCRFSSDVRFELGAVGYQCRCTCSASLSPRPLVRGPSDLSMVRAMRVFDPLDRERREKMEDPKNAV